MLILLVCNIEINTIKTNGIRMDCEPLASNQFKKLSGLAALREIRL
jgi:hypothetical protein